MIVDSSAVMAILGEEPDGPEFLDLLRRSPTHIGAPTLVELAIVLRHRIDRAPEHLDAFLRATDTSVVAFTAEHAQVARAAYRTYGKGSGSKARLNFGDCLAYAVATVADEPLLFKGTDFGHTDVRDARVTDGGDATPPR